MWNACKHIKCLTLSKKEITHPADIYWNVWFISLFRRDYWFLGIYLKIIICLLLLSSKSSSDRNKNLSIFVSIRFEGVVCCLHVMSCLGKSKTIKFNAAAICSSKMFQILYNLSYFVPLCSWHFCICKNCVLLLHFCYSGIVVWR